MIPRVKCHCFKPLRFSVFFFFNSQSFMANFPPGLFFHILDHYIVNVLFSSSVLWIFALSSVSSIFSTLFSFPLFCLVYYILYFVISNYSIFVYPMVPHMLYLIFPCTSLFLFIDVFGFLRGLEDLPLLLWQPLWDADKNKLFHLAFAVRCQADRFKMTNLRLKDQSKKWPFLKRITLKLNGLVREGIADEENFGIWFF